jgi:hypothetical protein
MAAPKVPVRSRAIAAVFLAVWGVLLVSTGWEAMRGRLPAFLLFVTSAGGPHEFPRVDTDGRFDAAWRWNPTWLRGDELVRLDGVDLRGASAAAFTRELKAALRADGQAEIEWERGGEQAVDVYRSFVSAFAWLAGLPLSIASALAAVMLLLRAPDWPLSGLGFVFFAGLTLFAVDPGITPMPIGVPETAQLIQRQHVAGDVPQVQHERAGELCDAGVAVVAPGLGHWSASSRRAGGTAASRHASAAGV